MKELINKVLFFMNNTLKGFFSTVIDVLDSIVRTVLFIPLSVSMAFEETYYPEYKRKNIAVRILENLVYLIIHQRPNKFYCLFGFDTVLHKNHQGEFIDEKTFWKGLKKANYSNNNSQICLLRDKLLFFKYMTSNNLPVANVFAIVKNGVVYDTAMNRICAEEIIGKKDYFIKDINGECASFVKRVADYDELLSIIKDNPKSTYVLQEAITQHEEMNKLNPSNINTIRIVTVLNEDKASVLSIVLRAGSSKTGNVDNWSAGGIMIGINEDGYLKKYGFCKSCYGTKTNIHPDSKIEFDKFRIPHFNEVLEIACKAHLCFYDVRAIGWDIAVTPEGPIFVEGNDNFELVPVQACDKPLKKEWKDLFLSRKEKMNYLMCSVGRRGELMKDFRMSLPESSKIIATDNSKYAPALYFADKQYIVPLINDPKYVDTVLDICEKEKINAITTFIDPEIELLAKNREKFSAIGVEVLAPFEKTAELCFDKYKMFRHLTAKGVKTVMTWGSIEDFDIALKKGDVSFPVFIKPRTGSGSVGARKVSTYEELSVAVENDSSLIIQEFMACEDLDADVYIDTISHKAVSAFSKKKIETRIGGASKTISFKDQKLFGFIQEVVSALEFNGPVDMDFFCRDGEYYLSEVNPRFGGAYLHAYGAGVDFIKLIENNLNGIENEPCFGNYEEDVVMMMYDSVVIKKKDSMAY